MICSRGTFGALIEDQVSFGCENSAQIVDGLPIESLPPFANRPERHRVEKMGESDFTPPPSALPFLPLFKAAPSRERTG
jgi:hypothetical protein